MLSYDMIVCWLLTARAEYHTYFHISNSFKLTWKYIYRGSKHRITSVFFIWKTKQYCIMFYKYYAPLQHVMQVNKYITLMPKKHIFTSATRQSIRHIHATLTIWIQKLVSSMTMYKSLLTKWYCYQIHHLLNKSQNKIYSTLKSRLQLD